MIGLLVALVASFIASFLIVRYEHLHSQYSGDNNFSEPQKFHTLTVPRIGGIAIIFGLVMSTAISLLNQEPKTSLLVIFLGCSIPCFGIGLAEDLTKNISIKIRLAICALGGMLAIYLLQIQITSLAIPFVDNLLIVPAISIAFTCFAIVGLTNAYNIIDGFNGLASMVALIALSAIFYIAILVSDPVIASLALVMIGAICGFFVWNYPKGAVFLGDCGSYLIGFWIAVLSILLTSRHQDISPWFALMVNGYPIFETLFTIYRRKIHRGRNPGMPDAIHFHTLVFRRIVNPAHPKQISNLSHIANSRTSPYLWVLSGFAVIPAVLFWRSSTILMIFAGLFACTYIWIYKSIVHFKLPKWLKL